VQTRELPDVRRQNDLNRRKLAASDHLGEPWLVVPDEAHAFAANHVSNAASHPFDGPYGNGSQSSSRLEVPQEYRSNRQPLNTMQTALIRHSKAISGSRIEIGSWMEIHSQDQGRHSAMELGKPHQTVDK
jgi:hypothetical protein